MAAEGGKWVQLHKNIGITAMHMQLLHNDRVIIYDRTDFGASNISLPNGRCRHDPDEAVIKVDCTAHSVEYDVVSNSVRPLTVQTDVWCSSGTVTPDGELVQAGGFRDGERKIRIIKPCTTCDWKEIDDALSVRRWYATSHVLPDGGQIIVGGRKQFSYEFYPKRSNSASAHSLTFLEETFEQGSENNLYPFVFLNVDGNLFIFANNRAILLDYKTNAVVRRYPRIPGDDPRSYPSTGSAVLLPLKTAVDAEVLVCGGAPIGSFEKATGGEFVKALKTCGRLKITDASSQWEMETMPLSRVMGDMLLLPNGEVLIINGAGSGTAGWENGRNPVFNPVIYKPVEPAGSRFQTQKPTNRPRMYHSSAILVRDGRVLVGGSNPHIYYNFSAVLYPTDLSLESFSPEYLDPSLYGLRPTILSVESGSRIGYGEKVSISFSVFENVATDKVFITLLAPSFTTHSFSMSQRILFLKSSSPYTIGEMTYRVDAMSPSTNHVAPSGYYMLFVVHKGIPSEGRWIHVH